MSRISRISSLRASRIRANYINHLRGGHSIAPVGRLDATIKANNYTNEPSEGFLNSSDFYYQKLKELKKEFKKFYYLEKELLESIKGLDENKQKLVKHTKDLIDKYNQTLLALTDVDKLAGTHHVPRIREVLDSFSNELNDFGMTKENSGYLQFNPKTFVSFLTKDEETIEKMLVKFKTLIIQNYRSLIKIQISNKNKNSYEHNSFQYKGLIIEEES